MHSTIVWDWNGTLLDDLDVCIAAINRLLVPRALPAMNRDRYHRFFTFPVRLYYEAMGFDFKRESFADVAVEYHEAYAAVVSEAPLRSDAVEALETAANAGVQQVVLSALEETRLATELERRGIRGHFTAVYGLGDLHAAGKESRGHELVRELGLANGDACMIGDTTHDADVARAIGVSPILVSGGHHDRGRLEATGAPVFDGLLPVLDFIGVRL